MRPKQRLRKIYTEPDTFERPTQPDENQVKTHNINIKDLELNIKENPKNLTDNRPVRNFMYKNGNFYMPNKFSKINRKQLIKKLPDINLASLNNISRPVKLHPLEDREAQKLNGNKKNTFLLNSLFQILKPEDSNNKTEPSRVKDRSVKLPLKKNVSIDSFYENQFINVTNSSTKNRGPKIIENEITRLSNHNNIMRRRIVSEEKSRPKFRNESIDRLKETTFEHFKRCVNKQEDNLLGTNEDNSKENFQNLQIITFYNKFPKFAKKQQTLHDNQVKKTAEMQGAISKNFLKGRIKTEAPKYEQDNEFIFEQK